MNPDAKKPQRLRETPYVRGPGYARCYRDERFATASGPGTHRRETRALEALLAIAAAGEGPWLDMPAGTGRMSARLPGSSIVQVDRAIEMLAAAEQGHARVCASGAALPFADDTFAGCLCLRLMHHLPETAERVRILGEIRRVTDGPVVLSFFHNASLQHLRRVVGRALGRTRSGRCAVSWRRMRGELAAAGLEPRAVRPLRRFFSEQWLVLARRAGDLGG